VVVGELSKVFVGGGVRRNFGIIRYAADVGAKIPFRRVRILLY
jgi:hypothetical protein